MSDGVTLETPLIDDLQAALAGLEHARRVLDRDDLSDLETLWPRLERCATRIAALDQQGQVEAQPIMLALLDEVERTIAAFGVEHGHLADRLKSASLGLAAGAAYRQAKDR
jgi:hypothetical protein